VNSGGTQSLADRKPVANDKGSSWRPASGPAQPWRGPLNFTAPLFHFKQCDADRPGV
jgi:hypothetical protein